MIPEFTHWLIIPECEKHYAFAKAVSFNSTTNIEYIKSRGIKIFKYTETPPKNYNTNVEYK